MSFDLRVLVILDTAVLGDRDALDAARAAAEGGATALQVRAKDGESGRLLALARRLEAALPIPVWVNDRADVAWAAGAAGVHLGQDDLPADRVRALSPPGFGIGVSVGTVREAQAAQPMPVDYWSIGPLFATSSKPDAGPPLGAAGFSALRRHAPRGMPVVAIGGITAERVHDAIAAGATGVAVIGAVFASPDIAAATRRVRDAVDHAGRP